MEQKFEYQNISPRLEEILGSMDRPGDFCTEGRVSEPMPRLEVENVGILSFPVPKTQIEELIQTADPAPYGKGSQTLVDASVRNCWEINADRLVLGGQSWDKTIQHIRHLAANGLGCPHERLNAQLYKLLIYPTGGFFVPHRDTEKSEGMIATMTISLPVEGSGGELVVRHKNRSMTIEMNVDDPSEMAYAAFYADCQHEIKKIRSGHRIALVYNLCLEKGDVDRFSTAPDYTAQSDEIIEQLHIWNKKENAAKKLIWILDHEYSEAGLSFDTLKGRDNAVAKALKLACEKTDCELYASIVHISESFNAWPSGYRYRYGSGDLNDYEIDELLESEIWMNSWVSPNGSNPNFGNPSIGNNELMPTGILDDPVPDKERIDEATGNEGATLVRTYYLAALVLFRREGILDELVRRGAGPGVAWITEELLRNDEIVDDRTVRSAEKLIDIWPPVYYYYSRVESVSEMLNLLLKLNSQRTSLRFLRKIAIRHYKGSVNHNLAEILSTLEPTYTEDILRSLICEKFSEFPESLLQLLMLLYSKCEFSVSSRREIFATCATEILQLLPETMSQMTKQPHHSERYHAPKQSKIRKDAIKDLVMLFWYADAIESVISVAEIFDNFPTVASTDRQVPKALVELCKNSDIFDSDAYRSLWRVSANHLVDRSDYPPKPPQDWTIQCDISCSCPRCNQLRKFCANPAQSVARFPLRKDLRAHLHQQIDINRLDLFHETERKGSPYTLVLTKNRATYKRRLKEYSKDIKYMKSLIELMADAEARTRVEGQFTKLQIAVENSKHLDKT